MKSLTLVVSAILVLQYAPGFASAKTDANKSEIVIRENSYKIVSLDSENELGSCYVKAISKEKKKEIEIVEQMSIVCIA